MPFGDVPDSELDARLAGALQVNLMRLSATNSYSMAESVPVDESSAWTMTFSSAGPHLAEPSAAQAVVER